MKRKSMAAGMLLTAIIMGLTGCGQMAGSTGKVKLDPNNPVSLTIWHYYNGNQQATFDSLVEEFNATVGQEQGIYVEGYSQGSVSDLEQAVTSSLKGEVGAEALPDIFSSYADTAYAAQQQGKLADLSQYFTEDELSEYVDSYIQEGYFGQDKALYLFPTAKSTEIMMINKTDWEPFAAETGVTTDDLATIEGVVKVAEKYYDWTDAQTPDVPDDGKAFYGRDSMSNYFVIGMKQQGKDIFQVEDGKGTAQIDRDSIRRLWDNYYVPYIKGYFMSYGKFRSDDIKTGDLLAYTGSTSSSFYFPDSVETDTESYPIDYIVLNAPVLEGGDNVQVQQGAGMVVTKSDETREYAACVFLKWFTQKEQNLRFASESGYLPVKKEANNTQALDEVIADSQLDMNPKVYDCLTTVLNDFDNMNFYTPACCENGYQARKVLDYNLSDQAVADKQALEDAVAAGASREEEIAKYTSDESFEAWYAGFSDALTQALNG